LSTETAVAAAPQLQEGPPSAGLPPGPQLPRWAQTFGFLLGGIRFLEICRRRYGGAVYMQTVFDEGFVMLFDPALVREVFQGPHERLNAGEANRLLGPILGSRSVLVLDGAEHLRHRKLMLPPFHGRRMRFYEDVVRDATDAAIDGWPLGGPFALLPSLQSLTLRVVVRAVFGYEPGPAEEELRRRLRAMITPVAQPRGLLSLFLLPRLGLSQGRRRFDAAREQVDELLYAEIEKRRADPGLAERDDVFSALLLAEDEDGQRLSASEVRDELITLLVAGHETTATGLAWTFDLLLREPAVLARAQTGDDSYLDAIIKESLRLRPVIPAVGRIVRGSPFELGDYVIPEGVELNPSIRVMHMREDLYPQAKKFRPERFLGPDAPDTYTWIPFGGGTRRCLGASFAQMEMRIVLRRILERTSLRLIARRRDRAQLRAITLAPKHGVRVSLERRAGPGVAFWR